MVVSRPRDAGRSTLRLASRGSTLALWQAHYVQRLLHELHAGLHVAVDVLHTTGDRITDVPLSMIGDRGLFTKEVDDAVLDGRADFAVHSFKDVPTTLPDGLRIVAVLEREDPADAFLPAPGVATRVHELTAGARIGTSSLRRRSLLLAARPDIVVEDLRGNLDTRLERLHAAHFDGIILALAGLRRFGRDDAVGEVLGLPHWLPAAGQGALALVARTSDDTTLERLLPLDHAATRAATAGERAFLACLEGGCQIPIGALGEIDRGRLTLRGLVASLDGTDIVRGEVAGDAADALRLGEQLALSLIHKGADDILHAVRSAGHVPGPAAP